MKTILTTFFFLFFLIFCNARQYPIEHIFSKTPHTQANKVIHTNGMTFMGGSNLSCNRASVNAFDEFGELVWEYKNDGYSWVNDMVFRESDSTIIVGNFWSTSDDVPTEYDGPNIIGLSMDGDSLFEIHLSVMNYGGSSIFNPSLHTPYLTINDMGEITVTNHNKIFWLDPQGNFVDSVSYPDFVFRNILSFDDSYLVAADAQAVIINSAGTVEQVLEIGAPILDLEKNGNDLIILTANKIYSYNTSTSLLGSADNYQLVAEGMAIDENWLYLWGPGQNTTDSYIQQYNKSDYAFVQSITLAQDPIEISDIASDNFQIYAVGKKQMNGDNGSPLHSAFIKTTPIFYDPIYFGTDVGLNDFVVVEPAIVSFYNPSEGLYFYENDYMVFEYNITNFGTDTIHSFTVTSQRGGGFNCVEGRFFKVYDDAIILPGETITKKDSIGTFYIQFYSSELRLTAFAPNQKFDGDFSNNYLLGQDFILSTENTSLDFELEISPNPASDFLNIIFKKDDFSNQEKFRMVSLEGKIIEDRNLILGKNEYSIDLNNYPTGIYFFQYLKNGAVIGSKKIVVQQ